MARNRQVIVLAALLVVLAAVALVQWRRSQAAPREEQGVAANPARSAQQRTPARGVLGASDIPEVHLDHLKAERAAPKPAERDLFRFRPAAPPPPPPPVPRLPQPGGGLGTGPGGTTPPAPIPLRLIGIVESRSTGKLAVLRDERGDIFQGREGAVLDGRYRIVRIGTESVEMAWADGRGQPQRIPLSVQ
jgi:hypothetical protein